MGGVERLRVRYRQYATPGMTSSSPRAKRSRTSWREPAGPQAAASTTAPATSPCSTWKQIAETKAPKGSTGQTMPVSR
jgi:hypothetical protein